MADVIKVKRDGPRGWHLIAAANYDPKVHELYEEGGATAPAKPVAKRATGKKA